jgi:DMSO/TMAO reductase YedYZ molybdopterin-dependent catalytic subunit
MNGEPLPPAHGGPARLVVPRWTGQHWMKWVTRLELHAAPLAGEYMDRAYRIPAGSSGALEVVAELPVKSVITTAPARARAGETVRIAGFAYSGAGAVARVEISDDGGATWSDAELSIEKDEKDPAAWRLWSASRTLSKRGRSVVLARATDAAGRTQPPETAWNPGGYLQNGWHSVSVEVA